MQECLSAVFRNQLIYGRLLYVPDLAADPDADGFNSWLEFIADTSPTNAADFLTIGLGDRCLPWIAITNLPGSGNLETILRNTNRF